MCLPHSIRLLVVLHIDITVMGLMVDIYVYIMRNWAISHGFILLIYPHCQVAEKDG